MLTSLSNDSRSSQRSSRQKLGSACEECRRRKLQCDREQPQCGGCLEANVECEVSVVHRPRGPKRGHLKALKTKIVELEQQLANQQISITEPLLTSGLTFAGSKAKEPPLSPSYNVPLSEIEIEDSSSVWYSNSNCVSPKTKISDLIKADLDQLYFERAHTFAPMLHRSRYFAWTQQTTKSEAQICLQYAMWTLAASLSASFQDICDSLYKDTRRYLEGLEFRATETDEDNGIEHAQAWILVMLYELMRTNYYRAWMSAGRCFRLIQIMRLFEMDRSGYATAQHSQTEMVLREEKRRAFWTAYIFDRFLSVRNECPLTLNEQVICTRLPVPNSEFQRTKFIPMPFLSEVIAAGNFSIPSGFTECIVFATILGRSISHQQQLHVENVYGSASEKLWDFHRWLDNILTERIKGLESFYESPLEPVDSMHIFTHMMSQTIIIHLFNIMESAIWKTELMDFEIRQYKTRAVAAAHRIVILAKALSQLSYFKVNPFTPIPLFVCAQFLIEHEGPNDSFDVPLREGMNVLENLRNVNNLADDYLQILENEIA